MTYKRAGDDAPAFCFFLSDGAEKVINGAYLQKRASLRPSYRDAHPHFVILQTPLSAPVRLYTKGGGQQLFFPLASLLQGRRDATFSQKRSYIRHAALHLSEKRRPADPQRRRRTQAGKGAAARGITYRQGQRGNRAPKCAHRPQRTP